MKPTKLPGHNLTLAENQPEYHPLPVCYEGGTEKSMTSCWKLSFWERIKLLFTGKLYLRQLTFGMGFHPISPTTNWKEPICKNCGKPVSNHKKPTFFCPHNLN